MKCLFNDALKPAAYMPNFTLAARSRAQFTMNSWKTGCGMEKALGQAAHSCPGCGWQGTEDSREAFWELCFLPTALAGALAVLVTAPSLNRGEEQEAQVSLPWLQGGGAMPQLPAHINWALLVNHQLRFSSVALLWEHRSVAGINLSEFPVGWSRSY